MAIISNKIKCKHCDDIIESTHVHDFKTCKCGTVSVDGGHEYLKRSFQSNDPNDDFEDLSLTLKPCPFCDGEAEVVIDKYEYTTEIYVQCNECFCKTDTYVNIRDRTDEECIKYAVEDWNRRVENKRVKQACEYLKKCLKNFDFDDGEEMTSLEGDIMSFLKDVAEDV